MKSFILKTQRLESFHLYYLNWKATFNSDCHDRQGRGKGDNHCWAASAAAGAYITDGEADGPVSQKALSTVVSMKCFQTD